MQTTQQVQLSQILDKLEEYQVINRQLYTKSDMSYLDLNYSSLTDHLYLFLYGINRLGYHLNDLYIICDVDYTTTEKYEMFSRYDFDEIEPMLGSFGIHTANYLEAEIEQVFECIPLAGCTAYAPESSELPTVLFIYDSHTVTQQAAVISCSKDIQSRYLNVTVCNDTIRQYTDRLEITNESFMSESSTLVIDGMYSLPDDTEHPYIFWRICQTQEEDISSTEYLQFFKELSKQEWKTICLCSDGLMYGSNPVAQEYALKTNCRILQTSTIPDRMLIMLAILHTVYHKQIEFSKFSSSVEDRYIHFVQSLFSRDVDNVVSRINSTRDLHTNEIYMIKQESNYNPVVLNRVNTEVKFRACSLDSVVQSVREILSDDKYCDFPGNFMIPIGSGDFSTTSIISSDDLDLLVDSKELKIFTFPDMLRILASIIALETGEPTTLFDMYRFENFIYKILRYLEQKLYEYNHLFSLADLICFDYRGTIYIGVAKVIPSYDVTVYYCTSELYAMHKTVSEIIPISVVSDCYTDDKVFNEIISKSGANFSRLQSTRMHLFEFLEGILTYYKFSNRKDLISEVIRKFYLHDNVYSRIHDWESLRIAFSSYGIRDLDVYTAPVTIYGGCNTHSFNRTKYIEVCPIAFERCPQEVLNGI